MLAPHDREALTHLAMDYIDAVNTRDRDRWASTWCEDATWIISSGAIQGASAIVDRWVQAMAGYDRVVQLFGGLAVDDAPADADEVTARVHFSEEIWQGDELVIDRRFTYHDRCRRTADGWRYVERRLAEAGRRAS